MLINDCHAEYRTDHSGRYFIAWALLRIPEEKFPFLFPSDCWPPFPLVTCSLFRRNRISLNLMRFQKNHNLVVWPEVESGVQSQRVLLMSVDKMASISPACVPLKFPVLNQSYQSCFTTVTLSICWHRIVKDSFELFPKLIAEQLLKDVIHCR